jgi:protein-disulfide isomerase/uncharacterized membrane protein
MTDSVVASAIRPEWKWIAFFALLFGFGCSLYSLYSHEYLHLMEDSTIGASRVSLGCDLNEAVSCSRVELSPYSKIFGVPVAAFGVAFFGSLLFLFFVLESVLWFAVAFFGGITAVLISLILFLISKFIIKSICIVCVGSYLANLALLVSACFGYRASIKERLSDVKRVIASCFKADTFPAFCGFLIVVLVLLGGSPAVMSMAVRQSTMNKRASLVQKIKEESELDAVMANGKSDLGVIIGSQGADVSALVDHDFYIGPHDAVVQIVEFADFQCPACQSSFRFLTSLVNRYSPNVNFVFRNFPLDSSCNDMIKRDAHPYACQAARLARCGGEQGKFFEIGSLFSSGIFFPDQPGQNITEKLITEVDNINREKLLDCISSNRHNNRVLMDIEIGKKLGLNSTPTIFINGYRLGEPNEHLIISLVNKLLADSHS